MHLYVGTSGYSYKEWKGHFYPHDLSEKEFLKYYGTKLNAVEINNTFYRLPKESVVAAWAEQVPENFAFSIKASQRITHIKRLKDVGDETEYVLRVVRTLKQRLGVVLFQLPPNMKRDLERLQSFLKLFAGDVRVAIEFRHTSWFDPEMYATLKHSNCSMCIADWDEKLEVPFVRTADWGYVRLRRENYTTADLKKWIKKIQDQDWKAAFVFFKHEDRAVGPKLAMKLRSLLK